MAKPAGSACNLDCTYCFYLSKQKLAGGPGAGHMHEELLERFIQDYIQSVTGDEVVFSWQGGEPTLRGLDFFDKVVALQKRHAKPGQRIENDLQTNGTLLDDDWARFLRDHNFLVGLSIDVQQSEALPAYCTQCEFLADCWGECPKNRFLRTPEGEPGLNYLCAGLRKFFRHASPAADRMAKKLREAAPFDAPR